MRGNELATIRAQAGGSQSQQKVIRSHATTPSDKLRNSFNTCLLMAGLPFLFLCTRSLNRTCSLCQLPPRVVAGTGIALLRPGSKPQHRAASERTYVTPARPSDHSEMTGHADIAARAGVLKVNGVVALAAPPWQTPMQKRLGDGGLYWGTIAGHRGTQPGTRKHRICRSTW
jgi:hypothetical protein